MVEKGKKRSFRFTLRLRTALCLLLLLQLPFAYLFYVRSRVKREEKAVADLIGNQGNIRRGEPPRNEYGLKELHRKQALQQFMAQHGLEEELYTVTHLTCRARDIDHTLEEALKELPNLTRLGFPGCTFTEEACLPSRGMHKLEELGFTKSSIPPKLFASITTQPHLNQLSFRNCQFPNARFADLGAATSLRQLTLFECTPNIKDWSFISKLNNLEYLILRNQTEVANLLNYIPSSLRFLVTERCSMGVESIRLEQRDLRLEELHFTGSDVSHEQLKIILEQCRSVRSVYIKKTSIIKSDVDELVRHFPDVRFE